MNTRSTAADPGPVAAAVECGAGCRGSVALERALRDAPRGQWTRIALPLSCFARAGADMRRVTAPLSLTTAGALDLTISSVRLVQSTGAPAACTR